MKLEYSPLAEQDLFELREYTGKKSKNKNAAQRLIEGIVKGCSLLKEQPKLGMSVQERMGLRSHMRCLVVGRYIVFYRDEIERIRVIRVLDSRMDYISRLVPIESDEKD